MQKNTAVIYRPKRHKFIKVTDLSLLKNEIENALTGGGKWETLTNKNGLEFSNSETRDDL